MADFSTWDRATLEQFAREATDKLIENKKVIDAAKNLIAVHGRFHTEKAFIMLSDAVAKHESTTNKEIA